MNVKQIGDNLWEGQRGDLRFDFWFHDWNTGHITSVKFKTPCNLTEEEFRSLVRELWDWRKQQTGGNL